MRAEEVGVVGAKIADSIVAAGDEKAAATSDAAADDDDERAEMVLVLEVEAVEGEGLE